MAKVVDEDVVEQILMEIDAKDLVRFKRVCKSWYLLITSPRFIRRHLKHSYNKDRCNNEYGNRRFILSFEFFHKYYYLHGSSNGLLCMSDGNSSSFFVCNPLTREVRQLELPLQLELPSWYRFKVIGFGYDSTSDDYKAIVGTWLNEFQTYIQMLNLKSGVWKAIGEVRYGFLGEDGVLCNGSLHWIVRDENYETLIVSYDLSKDEFKEIPQPDDARYGCSSSMHLGLGVLKECLCIFCIPYIWDSGSVDVWLMKNYNRKQSWKLLPPDHIKDSDYDIVHYLRSPSRETFLDTSVAWDYINAPIFVQSLVSPHVNGRPTQKRNNKRSAKLINDEVLLLLDEMPEFDSLGTVKMVTRRGKGLLVPGPSARF